MDAQQTITTGAIVLLVIGSFFAFLKDILIERYKIRLQRLALKPPEVGPPNCAQAVTSLPSPTRLENFSVNAGFYIYLMGAFVCIVMPAGTAHDYARESSVPWLVYTMGWVGVTVTIVIAQLGMMAFSRHPSGERARAEIDKLPRWTHKVAVAVALAIVAGVYVLAGYIMYS